METSKDSLRRWRSLRPDCFEDLPACTKLNERCKRNGLVHVRWMMAYQAAARIRKRIKHFDRLVKNYVQAVKFERSSRKPVSWAISKVGFEEGGFPALETGILWDCVRIETVPNPRFPRLSKVVRRREVAGLGLLIDPAESYPIVVCKGDAWTVVHDDGDSWIINSAVDGVEVGIEDTDYPRDNDPWVLTKRFVSYDEVVGIPRYVGIVGVSRHVVEIGWYDYTDRTDELCQIVAEETGLPYLGRLDEI